MRQRFVAAYVLALPNGNRWTRNTEFQGIATAQSGQPFTTTLPLGDDNSNTGNTGQQAGSEPAQRSWQPLSKRHHCSKPVVRASSGTNPHCDSVVQSLCV